jgi:hypothetical protein
MNDNSRSSFEDVEGEEQGAPLLANSNKQSWLEWMKRIGCDFI